MATNKTSAGEIKRMIAFNKNYLNKMLNGTLRKKSDRRVDGLKVGAMVRITAGGKHA